MGTTETTLGRLSRPIGGGAARVFMEMLRIDVLMLQRNRQVLVFNLLVPLLMITIFGALFQHTKQTVAVFGPPSEVQVIARGLPESSFIVSRKPTAAAARGAVVRGTAAFAMVAQGSAPAPIVILVYVSSANQTVNGNFLAVAEGVAGRLNAVISKTPPKVVVVPRMVQPSGAHTNKISYIDYLVPGILAYAVLTAGMLGSGMRMVTDRERGVLRRMRATPTPTWLFLAAQIASQLLLVAVQAIVLLGTAHLAYQVDIQGPLWLLALMLLVGALCFLAGGFLVAGIASGPQAAIIIGNLVTLPQLFIAGIFFPLSQSPPWLQKVAVIMPLRYFSQGLRGIMSEGRQFGQVWPDLAVLAGVGVVLLVMASRTFRFDPVGSST